MSKADTLRLKRRELQFMEIIEVALFDGEWEQVLVQGMTTQTKTGQVTEATLKFDDGSTIRVHPDDIQWRRMPS